jgi:hypothetical protein
VTDEEISQALQALREHGETAEEKMAADAIEFLLARILLLEWKKKMGIS